MVKDLAVVMFAMAAGFTLSGIVANLYGLLMGQAAGEDPHLLVMVVAGPNVLLQGATKSMRAQSLSQPLFWLASAVAGYWSFVLGLFILNLVVALKL
jgi:hypothetical protein